MLAWLAVVQDYAVLGSHGPLVQAAYTPRLLQPLDLVPTPSIIAGLEPHLQACWPAALRALAAILPQAPGWSLVLSALVLFANAERSMGSLFCQHLPSCPRAELNPQSSVATY